MSLSMMYAAPALLMNILAFCVYGVDKFKSQHDFWRTPEATLLWLAFLGGSLGALLGMFVFRHKTQHKRFRRLVPLFLVLHVCFLYFILNGPVIKFTNIL